MYFSVERPKCIWGNMSDTAFRCAFNSNEVICKISNFEECDIYEGNIDDHLMSIYSILYSAADMSLEKVVSKTHNNTTRPTIRKRIGLVIPIMVKVGMNVVQ